MPNRIVSVKLWGSLCDRIFQILACLGYAEKYNLTPCLFYSLMENNIYTKIENTIKSIKNLFPTLTISSQNLAESDCDIISIDRDNIYKWIELKSPDSISTNPILLIGLFQSELYFPKHLEYYLAAFTESIDTIKQLHSILPYKNTYFIYIRNDDYVTVESSKSSKQSHIQSHRQLYKLPYPKYFQKAINIILAVDIKARFIIFANETNLERIRSRFQVTPIYNILDNIDYSLMLEYSNENNHLDILRKMILCSNGGICINSSFSWIAAFLSRLYNQKNNKINKLTEHPNQIFIMPGKWFNDTKDDQFKDIYPSWGTSLKIINDI